MQPRACSAFCLLLAIMTVWSCKKPFAVQATSTNYNYLVVEGFINIADSTYFTLSRTQLISAGQTPKPELKATVTIQDATGKAYPVYEIGNGVYGAPNYSLSAKGQYCVYIKTFNGNVYQSDLVTPTITPPIDSVTWKDQGNGVKISLNTHDNTGAAKYFRWDYQETWEIYTFYTSNYIYQPSTNTVIPRTVAQQVHHCWGHNGNPNILLASTNTSSKDIISNYQLEFIPRGNEKLSWEFSTIVKQYALSKDAYDYYSLLKKNTEELGSIFDAQPSTSLGNIHCSSNATEPVIGYIAAGTAATSNRIIINRYTQLPVVYYTDYYTNSPYTQLNYCDKVNLGNPSVYKQVPLKFVPVSATDGITPPGCADCTINGASTTRPSY